MSAQTTLLAGLPWLNTSSRSFLTEHASSSFAANRVAARRSTGQKGTLETLKAAGDKYKVLADQTANFKRDQGMTVTQNLLTSIGTPPDVIICSNDDMALGAEEALSQAGIPKGKVMVIGFDALPEALAKIRRAIRLPPSNRVRVNRFEPPSKIIVDHLRKKSPLHDESIKPFLVDKSNLDQAERIAEAK